MLVDPKLVAGRNRLQEELRAMLSRVDANAAAKVAAARPASAPIRAAPRTLHLFLSPASLLDAAHHARTPPCQR